MFESFDLAPPDPILGLTEAFHKDPRPEKINLGVGVYQDATGRTPVLQCVKRAEEWLLASESSKDYLGIAGLAAYDENVARLLFGPEYEVIRTGRYATVQTPGGTGALCVAADFIRAKLPHATVWLSEPTWPNHPNVFRAAGVPTKTYPYFDAAANAVGFDALLAAVEHIPRGDVLLLHACCHNPTGADLVPAQWNTLAALVARRGLLPLLDFAYQGFAEGLVEDAAGLLALAQPGAELLVCSSFSKNFGLYNERVGALTVIGPTVAAAQAAFSHVKQCIRTNYSNPPCHGAAVVAAVLSDVEFRRQWEIELAAMRQRIAAMRSLFVRTLAAKGAARDFSFLLRQRGMFSFSGLTKAQVDRLRDEFAIYIVGSGRINVAGMTETNMDRLCAAVAAVLRG